MRSIQSTTQRAFEQALACTTHRLPSPAEFTGEVWLACSAVRYGLFGCAATHALLIGAGCDEEVWVLDHLGEFGEEASDHFLHHGLGRAPRDMDVAAVWRLGEMAQRIADDYAPLGRRCTGVAVALRLTLESFVQSREKLVFSDTPWWRRREVRRRFEAFLDESVALAERLYERRLLDIDEVPEIALLGE